MPVGANNPLNLRYNPENQWEGARGQTRGFVDFNSRNAGLRASDITLENYGELHGINTVEDIINRFSPPSDNNPTQDYVNFVSSRTGLDSRQEVDLSDPAVRADILSAMADFENEGNNNVSSSAIRRSRTPVEDGPQDEDLVATALTNFRTRSSQQAPEYTATQAALTDFRNSQQRPSTRGGGFVPDLSGQQDRAAAGSVYVPATEERMELKPVNWRESFDRGLGSGLQGIRSDMNYLQAIGNIIIGDTEDAAAAVERARLNKEQAGVLTAGSETFEEFLDEPTFGGFMTQAFQTVGMVTPFAAETIATAFIGGVGGAGIKLGLNASQRMIAKKVVKDILLKSKSLTKPGASFPPKLLTRAEMKLMDGLYANQLLARQSLGRGVGKYGKRGGMTGAFAGEYPIMTGEHFGEFDEAGVELDRRRAFQAMGMGVPSAAVGVAGESMLLSRIGRNLSKVAAKKAAGDTSGLLATLAKNVGGGAARQAFTEGTTETIQEGMLISQRMATDKEYARQDALMRLGHSAFAGAIAGSFTGGTGGVLTSIPAAYRSGRDTAKNVKPKIAAMIGAARQQQVDAQVDSEQYGTDGYESAPEAQRDINAQKRSVERGVKPAFWQEDTTNERNLLDREIYRDPKNNLYYTHVEGRGTLWAKNEAVIKNFLRDYEAEVGNAESVLAAALGYSAAKPEVANQVVQIRDKNTNDIISEELTDDAGFDAAVEAARKIAQQDDTLEITTTSLEDALLKRNERVKAEEEVITREMQLENEETFADVVKLASTGYERFLKMGRTEEEAIAEARKRAEKQLEGDQLENAVFWAQNYDGFLTQRETQKALEESERLKSGSQTEFQRSVERARSRSNEATEEDINKMLARREELQQELRPGNKLTEEETYQKVLEYDVLGEELDRIEDSRQQTTGVDENPDTKAEFVDIEFTPEEITITEETEKEVEALKRPSTVLQKRKERKRNFTDKSTGDSTKTLRTKFEQIWNEGNPIDWHNVAAGDIANATLRKAIALVEQYKLDPASVSIVEAPIVDKAGKDTGIKGYKVSIQTNPDMKLYQDDRGNKLPLLMFLEAEINRAAKIFGKRGSESDLRYKKIQIVFPDGRTERVNLADLVAAGKRMNQTDFGQQFEESGAIRSAAAGFHAIMTHLLSNNYRIQLPDGNPLSTMISGVGALQTSEVQEGVYYETYYNKKTGKKEKRRIPYIRAVRKNINKAAKDILVTKDGSVTLFQVLEALSVANRKRVFEAETVTITYKKAGQKEPVVFYDGLAVDEDGVVLVNPQEVSAFIKKKQAELEKKEGKKGKYTRKPAPPSKTAEARIDDANRLRDKVKNGEALTPEEKTALDFYLKETDEVLIRVDEPKKPGIKTPDSTRQYEIVGSISENTNVEGDAIHDFLANVNSDLLVSEENRRLTESELKDQPVTTTTKSSKDEKIPITSRTGAFNFTRFVESTLRRLKIDLGPISVVRISEYFNLDPDALRQKVKSQFPEASEYVVDKTIEKINELQNDPNAKGRYLNQLSLGHLILVDDIGSTNPVELQLTVAHEMGHAFFQNMLQNAVQNKKLSESLLGAWKAARDAPNAPQAWKGENVESLGFEEWVADNFARWAVIAEAKSKRGFTEAAWDAAQKGTLKPMSLKEARAAKPENQVESFFARYANKFVEMWTALSTDLRRRFGKNESSEIFSDYLEEVIGQYERVKTEAELKAEYDALGGKLSRLDSGANIVYASTFEEYRDQAFARYRKQRGETGPKFQQKVLVRNISQAIENDQASFSAQVLQKRAKILEKMTEWPIVGNIFNLVRTADGMLRGLKGKTIENAGKLIADMFEVSAQTLNPKLGMFRSIEHKQEDFKNKITAILGLDRTTPENIAALEEAFSETATAELSDKAKAIRHLLEDTYDNYIAPANTKIRKQSNYFPIVLNLEAIAQDPDAFIKLILDSQPVDPETGQLLHEDEIRNAVEGLVAQSNGVMEENVDPRQDKDSEFDPSDKVERAIKLTVNVGRNKLGEGKWVLDPDVALEKYLRSLAYRIEWNRHTKDAKGVDRLKPLLDDLSKEDRAVAVEVINSYLGYNRPMDKSFKKLSSWLQTMAAVAFLPFTVFASLSDLAGPLINSKEFGTNWNTFGNAFHEIMSTWNGDNTQLAMDINVASAHAATNSWFTQTDSQYMDPTAKMVTEKYFKWTGLEWFTRFSRQFASGMGKAFLLAHAHNIDNNPNSTRYLAQLGLTADEVLAWEGDLKSKGGHDFTTPEGQKVKAGLQRFVESSILRPNAAQRPLWAADPRFALIWQLKSFFYAFHKTTIHGIFNEMKLRDPAGKGNPINHAALPLLVLTAVATMPLAMVGLELREYTKAGLSFVTPGTRGFGDKEEALKYRRSNQMGAWEYTEDIFDRAGFYGIFSIFNGAHRAAGWGQSGLASILGPTAETLDAALRNGIRIDQTFNQRINPIGVHL